MSGPESRPGRAGEPLSGHFGGIARPSAARGASFKMSDPSRSWGRARPAGCSSSLGSRATAEAPAVDRRKPGVPSAERGDARGSQGRGRGAAQALA